MSDDFNGDNRRDVIISSFGAQRLQLLVGYGDGTFAPPVDIGLTAKPDFVTSADLDKDGNSDIVAVSFNANSVIVLMGNGDGTFENAITTSAGTGPRAVVTGDFTGDGKLDLLAAKSFDTNLTLLRGNGNGTFQAAQNIGLSFTPSDISAGDFNNDGKLDVAAVSFFDNKARILTNNGTGGFSVTSTTATGVGPTAVTSADFDGDGNLDIASANFTDGNVSVLLGDGDGTLQSAVNYSAGAGATHVISTDLDGDENQDLIVTNATVDSISILEGDGDGSFQSAGTLAALDQPRSAVVDDFNRDGVPDVAVVHQAFSKMAVFTSTTVLADVTPPTVTLISAPSITAANANPYDFIVRYDDNFAMDISTIGHSDIVVTGPNGYSQLVTVASIGGDDASLTVTYRIVAPATGWVFANNGAYTITVRSNQVYDAAGNRAPAGSIGTFSVNVPPQDTTRPTAQIFSATQITAGNTNPYQFVVRYTDNEGLNLGSIGRNDIVVTGPNAYSALVSFVSMTGSGDTRNVTYSIAPPSGGWKYPVNGTYSIAMRSNQVADAAGNFVKAGSIGSFVVNVPKPDYAGNTTSSAKSLGALGAGVVRIAEDLVSSTDRNDYYKITSSATISLDVRLTGLTDNADIQLYDSSGRRIALSASTGTANERFTRNIKAGTYFIRVLYFGSGATPYRLRVAGAPAA